MKLRKGVRCINLNKGDLLLGVARIVEVEDDDAEGEDQPIADSSNPAE